MPSRSVAELARFVPWVARLAWVLVAIVGGPAVEGAVTDRSAAVRWTVAIGCWVAWAAVALALALASVHTLTLARVAAPIALPATIWAAVAGATATDVMLLAVPAFVAVLAIYSAEFGRRYVQASAYGDEQRFPLRAPVGAGAAAVIAWVIWVATLGAGPLLTATGTWIPGVVLSIAAIAGAAFFGPRWDRLAQRWFVTVPAGVVLHDPMVLADTLALRRNQVAGIRLAPADTGAADFTGPASGYAIEVATTESISAVFAYTPGEPDGRAIHLTAFLVAPSRPGRVLRACADRALPVR